jgi:phosphoglycolate phosphatase-like HAD superfamily hydrolase
VNCEKVFSFHFLYVYTYFITIATNYRYNDTTKIYKKFQQYIYNHDKNSHVFSVKEYTTRLHGLHYHVLVFTNKRLDYSRIHKKMLKHSDIRIEIVPKTKSDIKKVLAYMTKSKK